MTTERLGVREVRQNLSRYLDRVRKGEAFEVTEHGRPVAVLSPIPGRTTVLERLEAEGRARLGTGRNLADLGSPPPSTVDGPSLTDLLEEVTEDRL